MMIIVINMLYVYNIFMENEVLTRVPNDDQMVELLSSSVVFALL